ncbi:tetratricopeptide repeat protein [Acetanaerobacterium elongatum]|uniref:tetratricopeptide repeat protein n=1 Tax=Acetanaerobacterium elongatum TaxID=258515 RepID=UPI000B87DB5E|nr:tetratricopeptide repeat protein [Acetanaerobacterium elongatum]
MEVIKYEGRTYTKVNGKWFDSMNMIAPLSVQSRLNFTFSKGLDYDTMDVSELIKVADDYKASQSFGLALKAYESAIKKSDNNQVAHILPRITSCYRSVGQPEKAIQVNSWAKKLFGASIISPALLTSIAAAYCDMGEYDNAKRCCDRAYAMAGGKGFIELSLVYKRIESQTK